MARVTVVDDNPEFLELMGEVLESERHETTQVDGDLPDAIELVKASKPDVLVLDLRMSSDDLHGWQRALEIRSDPAFERLPILVCSADLQAIRALEDRLSGHGGVEVMAKPFGIDALTAAIDRLLREPAGR
jgi:CheY-like chemotaxis protein